MEGAGGIQGAYIPQELLKELGKTNHRLLIGIPRERDEAERRLILTPEAVDMLVDRGYRVLVEEGAGLGINYSDTHYAEAGAEIVSTAEEVYQADVILKVLPPTLKEVLCMKTRATLFASLQFSALGAASIMIAAELLSNAHGGKGILLGGVPGVSPTEVVIIGAGHAGTVAARAAMALGASVKVFDEDVNKLRMIQQLLGQGLFTSTFHPNVLHNAFRTADVVIGAMRYINRSRRYVIAEDMVRSMKKGSLVIDLRMNQGGCFETTCCLSPACFETTCCLSPAAPMVFEQYGVLHYCRPNISNYVARTASMALSNLFVPLLFRIGDVGGIQSAIRCDTGLKKGVYLYAGKPVCEYVSGHFNIRSNDIDIYLTAF